MPGLSNSRSIVGEFERIGARLKPRLGRVRQGAANLRLSVTPVEHRSSSTNIYHCCVQKTASQWVRAILSDRDTYRHSGLRPYQYFAHLPGGFDPRDYNEKTFDKPFPTATIATPFYTGFDAFASMPKPPDYAAFFVSRDPRDIIVSNYFSTRYSHGLNPTIVEAREKMRPVEVEEGLMLSVDRLQNNGLFDAMRSWIGAAEADDHVVLVRFEDLVDEQQHVAQFTRIFSACDIQMPAVTMRELLSRHSFERLSGRDRGEEDINSHYRQGLAGDWRNHMTPAVEARINELVPDLISAFGGD